MYKSLVFVAAIFAVAQLATSRVEAGASASAPSKYTNAVASYHTRATGQAQRRDFAITEYSSSSARNPSRKHH
jgi:hypothetical protein